MLIAVLFIFETILKCKIIQRNQYSPKVVNGTPHKKLSNEDGI